MKSEFHIEKLPLVNNFLVTHKSGFKMSFSTLSAAKRWVEMSIKYKTLGS